MRQLIRQRLAILGRLHRQAIQQGQHGLPLFGYILDDRDDHNR